MSADDGDATDTAPWADGVDRGPATLVDPVLLGDTPPGPAAAPPPAVEAVALRRVFAGPPEVVALAEATFTVEHGEMAAVVGPSGSGKSTLLNVLGLLQEPTSGDYLLDGTDVVGLDEPARNGWRALRIGTVFQAFHLLDHLTCTQNVELGMRYAAVPRGERRARAIDALQQVGLGHRLDARPTTLSGGERQRVAIARAVAKRPTLLLADEPTGNLDSAASANVMALLAELNTDGLTIMVVTHDPSVAAACPRELRMLDGVLTAAR